MNELKAEILKDKLQAIKRLRENAKEVSFDVEEMIQHWDYSGLFITGCPRCGSTWFWVPPFKDVGKGQICSYCFYNISS